MSYAECLATEMWVYIQKILAWLKGVAWQPCGASVVGVPTAALPMEHGMWCRLTTAQHFCNYSVNWNVQFGSSFWSLCVLATAELGLKTFLKFICYYYWLSRQKSRYLAWLKPFLVFWDETQLCSIMFYLDTNALASTDQKGETILLLSHDW